MRTYLILLVLVLLPMQTHAQCDYALTREVNEPRHGDVLQRLSLEPFVLLHNDNARMLWNFSDLIVGAESHPVTCKWWTDSTYTLTENKEVTRYLYRNNSACVISQRSPAKRLSYLMAETTDCYPLTYQDSFGDYFYSEGTFDGNQYMRQSGYSNTTAIAMGCMITPDADSLRNVLLVSYVRNGITHISSNFEEAFSRSADSTLLSIDSINNSLHSDSITHGVETLRWYAQGFRYPVIEATKLTTFYYGVAVDSVMMAYYYSPTRQKTDLVTDAMNDSLFEIAQATPFVIADNIGNPVKPIGIPSNGIASGLTENGNACHVSPALITASTDVHYQAANIGCIEINIYALAGSQVMQRTVNVQFGQGTVSLDLAALPRGVYMVVTKIGSDFFSQKIFKR